MSVRRHWKQCVLRRGMSNGGTQTVARALRGHGQTLKDGAGRKKQPEAEMKVTAMVVAYRDIVCTYVRIGQNRLD